MKFAVIEVNRGSHVALVVDDEVIDLAEQLQLGEGGLPHFLSLGDAIFRAAESLAKSACPRRFISDVVFRSPVEGADKIVGVGMNYHSFVAAARNLGLPIPADRIWFYRPRSCIAGPSDPIWLPRNAADLDYEGELAIVIGRPCRYVSAADASGVIAGFTIANDLTLRDRVRRSLVLAKSFDSHTPIGPWVVTPDEIGDPHRLGLRTWVNGELRQDSTTADMIGSCYELIVELSATCTLNPGDVVLTGTPDGCGLFSPAGHAPRRRCSSRRNRSDRHHRKSRGLRAEGPR